MPSNIKFEFIFICLHVDSFPKGRWFLTIVARNQMFMAVILESRHLLNDTTNASGSSAMDTEFIGPSSFYIEEIQDTLDHLRTGGVENLAGTWLNCNKRPEVCKNFMHDLWYTSFVNIKYLKNRW